METKVADYHSERDQSTETTESILSDRIDWSAILHNLHILSKNNMILVETGNEMVKKLADHYLLHPTSEPPLNMRKVVRTNLLGREYKDGVAEFDFSDEKVVMKEFLLKISSKFIDSDELYFIKDMCEKLGISSVPFLGEPKKINRVMEGINTDRLLSKKEYEELISSTR